MQKIGIIILFFILSLQAKSQVIDTVCIGNPIGKYGVSGMPGSIFVWNVTGGVITNGIGNDSIQVLWNPNAAIHRLSVFEVAPWGCVGDSIGGFVILTNNPVLQLNGPDSACFGSLIQLQASGGISYNWSNGDTGSTAQIVLLSDSIIRFVGTDGCGFDTVTKFIKVLPKPNSIIEIKPENPFVNKSTLLSSVGAGCTQYSWHLDNQFLSNSGPKLWHTFTTDGIHLISLTVGNDYNCFDTSQLNVGVRKGIINAFSPNNDGVNDVWELDELINYPKCKVVVFDKWGGVVFESIGYTQAWDGTNNGKELPSGSYAFIIDFGDNSELVKGIVTIIR